KFSWLASCLIFKTDHFQCVRNALTDLSPGGTNNFHGESHVVENRTFAQQPEVLENEPDVTAQFRHTAARDAVQVLTCHIDGTASGALFAQYQTKEGRLTRTGFTNQEGEFATVYLDAYIVQSRILLLRLVNHRDVFEFNHVFNR